MAGYSKKWKKTIPVLVIKTRSCLGRPTYIPQISPNVPDYIPYSLFLLSTSLSPYQLYLVQESSLTWRIWLDYSSSRKMKFVDSESKKRKKKKKIKRKLYWGKSYTFGLCEEKVFVATSWKSNIPKYIIFILFDN